MQNNSVEICISMAASKENYYSSLDKVSYEVRVTSYWLQIESLKARIDIREFKSTGSIWWVHKFQV